jgi:hypothetical protein
MIDALDETLKAVLREVGGLDADEVDVAFEAPDREWAGRVGKPTVNCYLYDIRENLRLRGNEWTVERAQDGNGIIKKRAPRRYDLSYVCTAWTNEIEDEHRLLWQVLAAMIRCNEIPRHLLQGNLANVKAPVITEVAQPDGLLRDPADVWSALDNRIRPSVNVVVTLPLDDSGPVLAPMVLTRRIRVNEPNRSVELIQIGGRVAAGDGSPIADATVRVRDHAFSTVTVDDGRFAIAGLREGSYTLIAETASGTVAREVTVPGRDYDLVLSADPGGGSVDDGSDAPVAPTKGAKRGRQDR